MPKKPFNPLDTAALRLSEIRRGQFIPSGAVVLGSAAGAPLSMLVIEALSEWGVPIGPKTAALIGIALSAVSGYLTRDGRRFSISFPRKFK
jgi:hypothetical protein